MKKAFLLIVSVLLAGCSLTDGNLPVEQIPPAATQTRTPKPSKTAPPPTLTFTPTPTLLAAQATDPSNAVTAMVIPSITPLIYLTPNTPTATVMMEGFLTISVFGSEFFKDARCQPDSVKIVAQVTDPSRSEIVDLFVRFNSKRAGVEGKWTRITMQNIGAGTFTHMLQPSQILEYEIFRNAWVQYQFISSTRAGREVGRTTIFAEALSMTECVLTPTPSVTPTPTILKP